MVYQSKCNRINIVTGWCSILLSIPPSKKTFNQKIMKRANINGSEGKLTPIPMDVWARLSESGVINTDKKMIVSKRKIISSKIKNTTGNPARNIIPFNIPHPKKSANKTTNA
ncbi:MAG: hypothetical protein IPK10_00910 [Bacteroidetes bacterium]|nr:hypothetical protein [Bacteroidota bacterium]